MTTAVPSLYGALSSGVTIYLQTVTTCMNVAPALTQAVVKLVC